MKKITCGFVVATLLTIAWTAHAQRPLRLEVESPSIISGDIPMQHSSGWPLRFKITPVNDAQVRFVHYGRPRFPEQGATSYLLLKDQDECPYLTGEFCVEPWCNPGCPATVGDEQFLEFTPDIDTPGVLDREGRYDLQQGLKNQRIHLTYGHGAPVQTQEVGPGLSTNGLVGTVDDGVGYGPNDDLPGMVVLSNVGVGRVRHPHLGAAGQVIGLQDMSPVTARNLAGLMTSVSVELRAHAHATVIRTSLNVPRHMFEPLRLIDYCYGGTVTPEGKCVNGHIGEQFEGGSYVMVRPGRAHFIEPGLDALTTTMVTVRAFVVQGTAPVILADCNADGQVTAADADCYGYERLSDEVVLHFQQMSRHVYCGPNDSWIGGGDILRNAIRVDFDGNGRNEGRLCPSTVSPSGNGTISTPPRNR